MAVVSTKITTSSQMVGAGYANPDYPPEGEYPSQINTLKKVGEGSNFTNYPVLGLNPVDASFETIQFLLYGGRAWADFAYYPPEFGIPGHSSINGYYGNRITRLIDAVWDYEADIPVFSVPSIKVSQDLSGITPGKLTLTYTTYPGITDMNWPVPAGYSPYFDSSICPTSFWGSGGLGSKSIYFGSRTIWDSPTHPTFETVQLYAGVELDSLTGAYAKKYCFILPNGYSVSATTAVDEGGEIWYYSIVQHSYIMRWKPSDTFEGMSYSMQPWTLSDAEDNALIQASTLYGSALYTVELTTVLGTGQYFLMSTLESIDDPFGQAPRFYYASADLTQYVEVAMTGADEVAQYFLESGHLRFATATPTLAMDPMTSQFFVVSAGTGIYSDPRVLSSSVVPPPPPDPPPPTTGDTLVRAWTFTIDGHDFYVLRLGTTETLVYDVYSQTWTSWASFNNAVWSTNTGFNWQGAIGKGHDTTVCVGDDETGQLYFLEPEQPYDQNNEGSDPVYFDRIAMTQVPMQGRKTLACDVIYLNGDNTDGYQGDVTLLTSDDYGKTFQNQGAITADASTTQEFSWRSLGRVSAPGRLFKIIDDGAFARIDNLEMNDNAG